MGQVSGPGEHMALNFSRIVTNVEARHPRIKQVKCVSLTPSPFVSLSCRSFPRVESEHCRFQCADVRVVTSFCALTLLLTAFFTIYFTPEVPLRRRDAPEGPTHAGAMVGKLLHMLLHMPPALARICAFQFLAWSAWFYHRCVHVRPFPHCPGNRKRLPPAFVSFKVQGV